jgi:hypothetical protein
MVMIVPATLAHVAVATGWFEKKIGVKSFHFICLPSGRTRSKSQLLHEANKSKSQEWWLMMSRFFF